MLSLPRSVALCLWPSAPAGPNPLPCPRPDVQPRADATGEGGGVLRPSSCWTCRARCGRRRLLAARGHPMRGMRHPAGALLGGARGAAAGGPRRAQPRAARKSIAPP